MNTPEKFTELLETPEGRAHLADMKSMMSKWVKDVGDALKPYAESGDIPGYEVKELKYKVPVSVPGLIKWLDEEGVDQDEYAECLSLDINKLTQCTPYSMGDLMAAGQVKIEPRQQLKKIRRK